MHTHARARAHAHEHAQVTNPIEPLMVSLVKVFVDEDDLNNKLQALYQVKEAGPSSKLLRRGGCEMRSCAG